MFNNVLNVKAVEAASNQEKALVGAFSAIMNLWMDLFEALDVTADQHCLEISQTSIKNWRLKKKTKFGYHGMLGVDKGGKKTF